MIVDFWIPAIGLLVAVSVVLFRAYQAPLDAGIGDSADRLVYRDQLAEVEREIARGGTTPEEGARLRAEVARRLLGAERIETPQTPRETRLPALPLVLMTALLAGGAGGYTFWLGAPGYPDLPLSARIERAGELYAARPSQATIEAEIGQQGTLPADPAEAALLLQLRTVVAARPDDLEGHQLLAKTEAGIGNLAGARVAYQRVVELMGDQAGPLERVQLAQLMIAAAGGIVTPQAEAELVATLKTDPSNGYARYYSGVMLAQVGRPDQAFALWRPLLDQSAPADPWYSAIREQIESLADAAGVPYTLPDAKGPDAAAVEAAGQMTAEERQEMIQGMVGGLEERLMTSGGSAEEWAKLVSSLGVLGETARQNSALEAGKKALANDPEGLKALNAAAGLAP